MDIQNLSVIQNEQGALAVLFRSPLDCPIESEVDAHLSPDGLRVHFGAGGTNIILPEEVAAALAAGNPVELYEIDGDKTVSAWLLRSDA